ncbi:DNA/RNA helicase domain-containing protein, partial [Sutterella sp.]|uniref:DNA/RNA helicase domain-containing protein n=1 Tax=Sutterella sp. TaxID=1981025 RepID=UPI0026E0D2FD
MIVYEGLKSDFLESVVHDTIAREIERKILEKTGRRTVSNEFQSWNNSMQYMYKVMSDPGIPSDAGIAIEYNVPQTAKRVDFMVSGYDAQGRPGMVIIELKQWSELKAVPASEALVETFTGNALRKVVHPSYQAWSYAQLIADYNSAVQDERIRLIPCAYLHNYLRSDNDPVDDPQYSLYRTEAPVFTKGQVPELRELIRRFVTKGDRKAVLYLIDRGKIRPSKSLQDSIASMIRGNREFVMIDEQRVVYEEVLKIALQCQRDGKKRTVICKGGPGTGKSVIAVQLLAELTQRDQFVQYVSKNLAPRQVYLQKLKGGVRLSGVENLFKGSSTYVKVGRNQINTLIADEAHRLEERSQYTKKTGNENQIKEIIHAACCSVFFIDERQRVTMSDIGSVEAIRQWAQKEGSAVTEMELVSQFRCNGSNGWLAWVDDMLDIRRTANYSLEGLDYEVELFDDPEAMRQKILERNRIANRARILAGYCWEWDKAHKDETNFHDIR